MSRPDDLQRATGMPLPETSFTRQLTGLPAIRSLSARCARMLRSQPELSRPNVGV